MFFNQKLKFGQERRSICKKDESKKNSLQNFQKSILSPEMDSPDRGDSSDIFTDFLKHSTKS